MYENTRTDISFWLQVYCGDCASQRAAKATPRKKASSKAPQKLEKCVVDDCASKLTGKLAMFPIYL